MFSAEQRQGQKEVLHRVSQPGNGNNFEEACGFEGEWKTYIIYCATNN